MLIEHSIEAHKAEAYALSIPVLFAQADGIAKTVIGECLFLGNPTSALDKTLSKFTSFPMSEFSDILLEPLRSRSRFYTCSPKKTLKSGHIIANRSEVLHGSQLDYGTERNSLRAIVLIGYLVSVKETLDSHSEQVKELLSTVAEEC